MRAKRYIILVLIITTILSVVACSTSNDIEDSNKNKTVKAAEIKIDVMKTENYILAAILKFNESHKNVKINYGDVITFNDDYRNKYITHLAVGEGPDIIRIEPILFSSANKTANSGLFYDLNKLIKKDKDFKLSDYNNKVLESGVFDGKRYFIPLGYSFNAFFTKGDALKDNGFTTEGDGWTLANFADEAYSYTQKNKDKRKFFMVTTYLPLSQVIQISGLNFINFKDKKATFESPEFIDLLNIYKKLNTTVQSTKKLTMSGTYGDDSFEKTTQCPEFENDSALIMHNRVLYPMWFRDTINKKTNVYLFPQYTSKKSITLEPMLSLAINAKCEYKDEAYEFIKMLLSEDYQSVKGMKRDFPYLPVNNNAYLNNVIYYIGNLKGQAADNVYDIEKRKMQVKKQLKEIDSISRCDSIDPMVYAIMDGETKAFIDGKKTAQQTAKIIQDKIMLYLNE